LHEAPQLRDANQYRVERSGLPRLARRRQTRNILGRNQSHAKTAGRVSNRADRPITHVPREERK